jgi:cytochrome c oxidase cbb3-type subunit 3
MPRSNEHNVKVPDRMAVQLYFVSRMKRAGFAFGLALLAFALASPDVAAAQGRGRAAGASPASQRPPQPTAPRSAPAERITTGQQLFSARCATCHGREAEGGQAAGTDLTRSALVAEDKDGDRIGPVIRKGRPDRGMPPIAVDDTDLAAIVAFVHDRQATAAAQLGGRRAVDVADLQTGDAAAGRRYFETACTSCHSAAGDLAKIGGRLQGLSLLQRMLYPGTGGGGAVRPARVVVTTRDGQKVSGTLAYRDEFTISLTDADGWHRSWPTRQVTFIVDDPLRAHIEQLGKYSDKDMHDVFAYLQTLK